MEATTKLEKVKDNPIKLDDEEARKREERIKRFGVVEPIKPTKSNINIKNEQRGRRERNYPSYPDSNSNSDSEMSSEQSEKEEDIKPKRDKGEYKINIDSIENPEFNKKRLILFGVNLLSSDDIEDYFNSQGFKVKKIFWLNDFSCIAEFDNETITLEAFCSLTSYKLNFEISEKENFNWKISKPFNLNERQLDIQLRDLEKKSAKEECVYYKFYSKRMKNTSLGFKSNRNFRNKRDRSRNHFDNERE